MGHTANNLRHLGMIATSGSWRRFWFKGEHFCEHRKIIAPERLANSMCSDYSVSASKRKHLAIAAQ